MSLGNLKDHLVNTVFNNCISIERVKSGSCARKIGGSGVGVSSANKRSKVTLSLR